MNRILFICLLAVSLVYCKQEPIIKEEVKIERVKAVIPEVDNFDYDTLQGMYIGDFGGSDIRLIINYVSQKNTIGYNIHKGLQRNLTGKVSRNGDSVQMILFEPGDNEFDGVFTLNFIGDDHEPTGKWVSNSGKISSKEFKLSKMVRPEKDSEDEINFSNFTQYFGYATDTIGEYSFKSDGLCTFEYYPYKDHEDRVEQLVEIHGSWSIKGQTVTINWQPNEIFPSRKMIYEIKTDEYDEYTLEGDHHVLYNNYWY